MARFALETIDLLESPMTAPLVIVSSFHFLDRGIERLREFQEQAAPSFAKHQLSIEKEITVAGRGQIGDSVNTLEQPDLIQISTIPSLEAFQAYLSDPIVQQLAPLRAKGLRKMTAHFGPSLELAGICQPVRTGATHFAAFARFKDESGLDALFQFNKKGVESGLFPRYGIHILHLARSIKSVAAVGGLEGDAPQGLIHFAVENPSMMKNYLQDPEYIALAPLRDNSLESYHFFLGA